MSTIARKKSLTDTQHPTTAINRRMATAVAACLSALAAAIAISPMIGYIPISLSDAWGAILSGDEHTEVYNIVVRVRLPRSLLALLAGSTLALCGAVFQAVFRNPLATPYTLGIASGGSLGALIAIKLGLGAATVLGISMLPVLSLAGSLAVVVAVGFMIRSPSRLSGNELLLAGITMGMFCSAMMMFLTYLADVSDTFQIVRWMMGSLTTIGFDVPMMMLPFLVPAWIGMLMQARSLNQYDLGPELAATRGVSPVRLMVVCVGLASVATAAVVAFCGPIGFVGLIVPHAVRITLGSDHRILLPCSALLGGTFLMICDWGATLLPQLFGALADRNVTAAQLPIGVITALVGAPVFLLMLRRRAGQKRS
ncbi:MAG: iron ABC transporter permease [Planctomycetes bacterium]|nr:iron ABC transporter permease [Planctomycetota bacterium]